MFLGIDCGTQGTKALIIDREGTIRGRGHAAHELIERDNGAREQNPQWWVDAMIAAVRQAVKEAGGAGAEVQALGVSGQQHGLVVLDASDKPIRPAKLWNDTETAPQNAELVRKPGGPGAWFEKFGIIPLTGYTISKLLWLRQKEPENFDKIRQILLPHDYLNFWLTGQKVAEYGDASGTGFFDIRKRVWAPEALALIDGGSGALAKALPKLVAPDAIVGTLTASAARELGLTTKCVVSVGGGDNMMGAIGTGNVRKGIVTMSLGTSATVYSYSNKPVVDPKGCVAPFCSSSGGWLPLVCTMNATNVTTQTASVINRDVAYISEALRDSEPGAGGISVLPFFNGERTPDLPTAQGSVHGLTMSNYTTANLMRAMVEGVSFGVIAGLRRILGSSDPERIFLIGGGARSAEWRQMIADATGAEIVVPAGEEAGALGGALQAMWAFGKHDGKPESLEAITNRCISLDTAKTTHAHRGRRKVYEDAFAAYRERLRQVHGVVD
jgi:xylulokinase